MLHIDYMQYTNASQYQDGCCCSGRCIIQHKRLLHIQDMCHVVTRHGVNTISLFGQLRHLVSRTCAQGCDTTSLCRMAPSIYEYIFCTQGCHRLQHISVNCVLGKFTHEATNLICTLLTQIYCEGVCRWLSVSLTILSSLRRKQVILALFSSRRISRQGGISRSFWPDSWRAPCWKGLHICSESSMEAAISAHEDRAAVTSDITEATSLPKMQKSVHLVLGRSQQERQQLLSVEPECTIPYETLAVVCDGPLLLC